MAGSSGGGGGPKPCGLLSATGCSHRLPRWGQDSDDCSTRLPEFSFLSKNRPDAPCLQPSWGCPGRVAQLVGASSPAPKGCGAQYLVKKQKQKQKLLQRLHLPSSGPSPASPGPSCLPACRPFTSPCPQHIPSPHSCHEKDVTNFGHGAPPPSPKCHS